MMHASRSDEGKAVQTHARAPRRLPLLRVTIFPERLLNPIRREYFLTPGPGVAQVSGGVGLGRPDVNHLGAAQASDGEFAQEGGRGFFLKKKRQAGSLSAKSCRLSPHLLD